MQLGMVLVLAAIAAGITSALFEDRRPQVSWLYMMLCSLFLLAAADDFATNPEEIINVSDAGVAHLTIVFLELSSIFVMAACVWWIIKGLWQRLYY